MYVDRFYRNLADNLDNLLGSDFYGQIAGDYDKPSADAQKYLLATSDSAKGMQTDITTTRKITGSIMLDLDRS